MTNSSQLILIFFFHAIGYSKLNIFTVLEILKCTNDTILFKTRKKNNTIEHRDYGHYKKEAMLQYRLCVLSYLLVTYEL